MAQTHSGTAFKLYIELKYSVDSAIHNSTFTMAAATGESYFRNVLEGSGKTLPRQDQTTPLVGTWGCISCVGVYFNIDEKRCFMAHINACNSVTYVHNYVTDEGGKDIQYRVVRRLCGFVEHDRWDIREHAFGSFLKIICPRYEDNGVGLGRLQHVGKFVVRGIREVFEHCASGLEGERISRPNSRDAKSEKLQGSADFLRLQARHSHVNTQYHGMTINPSTGESYGLIAKRPYWPENTDLQGYIPVDGDHEETKKIKGNCTFISMIDEFDKFAPALRNYEWHVQRMVNLEATYAHKYMYIEGNVDNLPSRLSIESGHPSTSSSKAGHTHHRRCVQM